MPPCEPDPNSYSALTVGIEGQDVLPVALDRRIVDKGPHMIALLHKRAQDRLDYYIDLRDFLDDGEFVTGAAGRLSPVTDPALAILRIEFDADGVLIWMAGGLNGSRYTVDVTITTSIGKRKMYRTAVLTAGTAEPGVFYTIDGDEIDLDGVGAGVGPLLALSRTTAEFDPLAVGAISPAIAVTVMNIGSQEVQTSAITVTGPFSFISNATGSLLPGDSFTLSIRFAPSAIGPASGILILDGNATATIALSGTGI